MFFGQRLAAGCSRSCKTAKGFSRMMISPSRTNRRTDGGRLPLTRIRRQATPSRTRFESLQSHQPLNPM